MMNKAFKTILIISIAIFGIGLLPADSVQAQGLLEIHFQNEPYPLFQQTNFLPGNSTSGWVEVTNISNETQKIGVEIIDKLESPCQENCLSDELNLVITEGENGTALTAGSLTTFYESEGIYLSDVGIGENTKYYFSINFNPEANDDYQNSEAKFDIKIGAFGQESISGEIIPGGGGGGGGIFIAGLQISNESASDISNHSVTITWLTTFESTSRVIYSPEGFPHLLKVNEPPNYGYVFSTPEDSDKVTFHSVIIDGLLSGTTYYYRCVSHASPPTITREYSFTTLGVQEEIKEEFEEGVAGPEEEIVEEKPEEIVLAPEIGPLAERPEPEEEAEVVGEAEEEPVIALAEGLGEEEEIPKLGLLAAIGDLFKWPSLIYLLIIVVIAVLVLLFLRRFRGQ